MVLDDFAVFRYRNRTLLHIKDGWCITKVDASRRKNPVYEHPVWRVYYGELQNGHSRPDYLRAVADEEDPEAYLDLPSMEAAIEWVVKKCEVRP